MKVQTKKVRTESSERVLTMPKREHDALLRALAQAEGLRPSELGRIAYLAATTRDEHGGGRTFKVAVEVA